MRKKDLIKMLTKAENRIATLENIICPAHQHKWFEDYVEEVRVCLKCNKVVFMDELFPNP